MMNSNYKQSEKNILVIGNGFDLYHGLPTKYGDFLNFIKLWNYFFSEYKLLSSEIKDTQSQKKIELDSYSISKETVLELAKFHNLYSSFNLDIFDSIIKDNSFINYFINSNYENKGWIDFELEIENIILFIQAIISHTDNNLPNIPIPTKKIIFPKYVEEGNFSGTNRYRIVKKYRIDNNVDIETLLKDLKKELDNLITCLNIYLLEFVDKMVPKGNSKIIQNLEIYHIINFNYTNTYNKVYTQTKSLKTHNLHGKIGEKNNIVLGMKDDKINDPNFEYVYFMKYFQRMQKKTGILYKSWINQSNIPLNNFFVFGHSLDSTDKDIFLDIIKATDTKNVTFLYRNQSSMEKFIINLLKILGKDDMLKYTANEKIIFKELK